MDTRSLLYFCEATKDLNFTRTANRMFISQQDLSNHIARLEKEFNCRLFERKPRLALTYSGQCLLEFAQKYQTDEDNIRAMLSDIKEKAEGSLGIGCSLFRTSIAMPSLAQRYHEMFPNVHLQFFSRHSDELMNLLLSGRLDFTISIDRFNHPLIETDILFRDSLYMMVSRKLLFEYYGENYADLLPGEGECAELAAFSALPFLNILSVRLIDDIFRCSGITPNYLISVSHPPFARTSLFEGIAASIVTKTIYLHLRGTLSEDMLFIPLVMPPSMDLHPVCFIRNTKKHYSKLTRAFHDLAVNYFSELSDNTKC
ncbi:MAG: LysR family transcriptional regulator [Clostridia bacterium]|nr:LysR family transcriptional regulator [Clostridia bacterium]